MTCKEIAEFLMSFLDGELPPEQRAAFERHLAVCPDCQRYLDGYRKAVSLTKVAYLNPDAMCDEMPEELVAAILRARGM